MTEAEIIVSLSGIVAEVVEAGSIKLSRKTDRIDFPRVLRFEEMRR